VTLRGTLRSTLLAAAALVAAGCGGDDHPFDFSEFDEAMDAFVRTYRLEGATAAVVHQDYGVVHVKGYGSFRRHRISLIASSSKVLSAGILMHLEDEGLLDVDMSVSEYLSAWGEHKTDITTAQLLSNSSGMPGLLDDPLYGPYICQYLNVGTLAACAEDIYTANDDEDRVPPDTMFRYGGGQWQLAGGLAETVSGRTWHELVDETYVRPCGLSALGYNNHFSRSAIEGGVEGALSYPSFFDDDPDSLQPTDNPNIEGGAYSTAEDYGKVLLMHLRDGRCGSHQVLSPAALERMREDRIGPAYGGSTIDPSLAGYGFGWWVNRANPSVVVDAGAYGATPWLDMDRGYGVMIQLEASALLSSLVRGQTQPILERIFDEHP
jgi:CubicO group peptidase (beta-lactamase class C family)